MQSSESEIIFLSDDECVFKLGFNTKKIAIIASPLLVIMHLYL